MQKHLGAGSKRCLETVAGWQKAANAAAVDASYQPPAERVRMGKEALATAGLMATPPETGGLIELLFDSFSHAALAGIRSAAMSIRQMLYRAEPDQIDIQLEAQPERNRLLVTGQLLDVSHPEVVGREVQVTLSDARLKTPATWSFPSLALVENPSSFCSDGRWVDCPERYVSLALAAASATIAAKRTVMTR